MQDLNSLDWITLVLVIIGALNWGLVGLLDFNVVMEIFGEMTTVTRVVYTLVGLSGLYLVFVVNSFQKG